MKYFLKKITVWFLLWIFSLIPVLTFAESVIDLNAQNLLPRAEIFINPRSSTFLVGSTFEAPIYINTRGNSINTINLKIKFDLRKLAIVNPSGGQSIFGIWVQPPQYDNTLGTASLAGVVPQGIVTSSGLIITMTFKVLSAGEARVEVTNESSANLNDGLGSEILLIKNGANYSLRNRAPDGVRIYSSTHPVQDVWYNNNSPAFTWDVVPGTTGYSIVFDTNPGTIPPNDITHKEPVAAFENVKDGIWYLHVKSISKGIWGATSHFQIRIDTTVPAEFQIKANSFKDDSGVKKYMASFFTTDSASGMNYYEVGVLDKNEIDSSSPVFIETRSPYIVPMKEDGSVRLYVRAHDNAGNIKESYLDLYPGYNVMQKFRQFGVYILILIIILLLIELVLHYIFGHRVVEHIKYVSGSYKKIKENEKYIQNSDLTNNLSDMPKPPSVDSYSKHDVYDDVNSMSE